MHGDETVGREMLVRLITYLCSAYNNSSEKESERITKLIDNTDIYIIPSMNPDGNESNISLNLQGFEVGRRANANFKDLNRFHKCCPFTKA
jgi:murein tripeptide amidase MpaA